MIVNKGPIAYFVGNPVAAKFLLILLIVGGVFSGIQLTVQHLPEIDLRTVSVTVRVPGASPKEIEEDVNRRLEESVVGLPGVARVVGTASQGFARLDVELETFADDNAVLADVRSAVESIENFPPPNAERPRVELKKLSLEVMTLAVASSTRSENDLRLEAERLRDALLALPSVSQVELRGTRDREITIEMNEEALRRHNLSLGRVARIVRRASRNATFGELRTGAGGVVLYAVGKRRIGEEFGNIPLITRVDGTIVTLGDVATIRDGFVDEDILSTVDGRPAVFVRVEASKEQSLLEISSNIKKRLETYRAPPGIEIRVWNDVAQPFFELLSDIARNAAIGLILVFVCLVLVFDLRLAFWITLGIPLSFLGSLMFFDLASLTLNLGTMFAFFLLIGIVVDDAVVVGESIAAERERGKNALDAAVSGTRIVAGPIFIGVSTTVLAFVPFLFVTEGSYQVIRPFFWVALFVLAVSLIEAFFILPSHLSHERRWSLSPLREIQSWARDSIDRMRDSIVVPAVSWAVRHVWLTIIFGLAFLIASLALLRTDTVRLVILDDTKSRSNTIQANLELPIGAPFEATVAVAGIFVRAAEAIDEQLDGKSIESISVIVGNTAGVSGSRTGEERRNGSHLASVRLHLHDRSLRKASPQDIERAWRRNFGHLPGLEKVSVRTTAIRIQPNVAYALLHDDPVALEKAARELKAFIGSIPGIYQLSDSLAPGKRHFEIRVTPAGKAAGLTPTGIGGQLRANFHGIEVQRIQRGRDEIRVVARYPAERRRSLRELASERIRRPGGGEVPLSTVARIDEKRQLAVLKRIDGKRTFLVNARADLARITPMQARRKIDREFLPGLVAKYPGLGISEDAGVRQERELVRMLGLLVPFVLLAMYALMAGFLRSYWKPVVAMAGVPIAFAGAIFGHWVLGWDVTAMSLFGVIGVGGVIVNDSLVLLDRYNTIRRDNDAIPAIAAASAATRHRFRAVFLTSLTTVLGLSPLLYERSDELFRFVPFVVSMLGGLVAAGIFTLFILPSLVMIVDGRRE